LKAETAMLASLEIENLAIVESARVEFADGLNAITGETGAGKSIIVGALELALGARASGDVVRRGARVASVEAIVEPPLPRAVRELISEELHLEWSDKEPLALRREIAAAGRGRCFIAGQLVNVADLKRLGERLVDLHGQHEHQSLFHRSAQRRAVDAFGDHAATHAAYRQAHAEWMSLWRRRNELAAESKDFEKRLDFLNYQIEEIDRAAPAEGEIAALESEEARLAHAETLAESAQRIHAILYEGVEEGASVLSILREARRLLERIGELDPSMQGRAERIGEAESTVEDLAIELRAYGDKCEADPARLEEVVERIEALKRLLRKHGAADEAALAALGASLKAERDRMNLDERERGEIDAKLTEAEKALETRAAALHEARQAAARKLAQRVERTLARVGMERAKLSINVERAPEPGADGADRVEFALAANPGEGAKPLREVASGGELSRAMLAIKTALAKRDAIPILVFDEIDAGLSGETAARVGELMADLAASHQIITITHHAAIAARAGRQISVRKTTSKGRTHMSAVALDREGRLDELARLMGGDGAGAAGRKLAAQLLGAE
jgi:DNA repair protein RecN (Recombination protein N)